MAARINVVEKSNETLVGRHVIVATGSNPRSLPEASFDEKLILSNTGALDIPEVPKRLGVIGAGVIGLEMGSVWRRLGSQVTILEALPVFLGAVDEQISKEAAKVFSKQGLVIQTGIKITRVTAKKSVQVDYSDSAGAAQSATFDKLIVSIGRIPNTDGLEAAAIGLKLDERGFVAVDEECRTKRSERMGNRRCRARTHACA
jgi:dihydrolipoamide dehydrogenase